MRFSWKRLLTNPRTHVESVEDGMVRLRVEGLVCDSVCAVRTRRALERVDGVRRVDVDFESGVASIEGPPQAAEAYEQAVSSAVAGRPLRRWLEAVACRLGAVAR